MPLTERSGRRLRFDDPAVCKYDLGGLCPHGLFRNTKSDLGACTYEVHSDHIDWQVRFVHIRELCLGLAHCAHHATMLLQPGWLHHAYMHAHTERWAAVAMTCNAYHFCCCAGDQGGVREAGRPGEGAVGVWAVQHAF